MIEMQISTPQTVNVDVPGKVDVTALPAAEVAYAKELVSQAREASKASLEAQAAAEAAAATAGEAIEGKLAHEKLLGRDAERQHPVTAIEGLVEELRRIPAPTEALTNFELEELLK